MHSSLPCCHRGYGLRSEWELMSAYLELPLITLFCSVRAALHPGWMMCFGLQYAVPIHFHLCSKLCSLHHPLMPANMSCEFSFLLSPSNLPLDCAGISLCHSASVPMETLLMSHSLPWSSPSSPPYTELSGPVTCGHELQTCLHFWIMLPLLSMSLVQPLGRYCLHPAHCCLCSHT